MWETTEGRRLSEETSRLQNWKRWGPYLSERQWATVREDYSPDGSCWEYFPHDHARSRTYRWGEDGLLGITDRICNLCFAFAFWNGKDPILKERLFGVTGPQGNHGEDVKEEYFYLDATPTHSYLKSMYRYPHGAFPYSQLVEENRKRTKEQSEFELVDTGIFAEKRYFDITAEYAKAGPDDVLIRLTVANRGPEAAPIHVIPTLWYRNWWSWGASNGPTEVDRPGEAEKPRIEWDAGGGAGGGAGSFRASDSTLGTYVLQFAEGGGNGKPEVMFTDNITNMKRLSGFESEGRYVKDAFHEYIVHGQRDAVNPAKQGTKAGAWYQMMVPAGGEVVLRLRLCTNEQSGTGKAALGASFDRVFADRIREAGEFYEAVIGPSTAPAVKQVARQAYAGLLFSKQFYHYVVEQWLHGDPKQPTPPAERLTGRNNDWMHLFNRDIISMPDKWEYPWYAAWDLAFHMIPMAKIDPHFAKRQLLLFLREWYMHPNGQLPAYEFALGDVNPPVHAWACWRVYQMTARDGKRDRDFLARCFQKLLINFTWWVNRKDPRGKNLFSGGFLGLDNIGLFDRSRPLPTGGHLEQADGTAWMAFYSGTMLSMAMELAKEDIAYEDMASKFFEHFVAIIDAMNTLGGNGLWDEEDGFYYDQLYLDGASQPLKVRSLVGVLPLLAVEVLYNDPNHPLMEFGKRTKWFIDHKKELAKHVALMMAHGEGESNGPRVDQVLLAVPSKVRLIRVLKYLLDENEFLSPYGVRSVSKIHKDNPLVMNLDGMEYRVDYVAGESTTSLFGGNSNWRGPIWFPLNYLIIESLEQYYDFYGDSIKVECPTGSGNMMTLAEVAIEIRRRLGAIFLPDSNGSRPCHGGDERFAKDPHDRNLLLFHEYFHGDTGKGLGANHQTGWTALAAAILTFDRLTPPH